MEQSFWQSRWSEKRLGFHLEAANPNLAAHIDLFKPRVGEGCILLPLCGKSNDLVFLARQGFTVHGVEFVEQAVRSFFLENDMLFTEFPDGCFQGLSPAAAERITLWRRDIFRIRRDELPLVTALYDRAALVALAPESRPAYARKMTDLAVSGALQLLIGLDYDQSRMGGPPHAVPPAEVERLYGSDWQIKILSARETIEETPHLVERGLDSLTETVYLMRRN